MGNGRGFPGRGQYASNGERIYFTGINQNGELIAYSGGLTYGRMMNQNLTCASCHGSDARGGVHVMHMQTMDTPAIYYDSLNEMLAEETGTEVKPDRYSLDIFRKAVTEGKHPDGDTLETVMPRWQMSDQDLMDLFAFLKTLP